MYRLIKDFNMRVLFIFMLTLLSITACTRSTDQDTQGFDAKAKKQIWTLFKMTGNTLNSETTGNSMAFQEVYELYHNGNFVKKRNEEGTITEAGGTYEIKEENNEKALLLTYSKNNKIIGNCTGDATEYLTFVDTIMQSSWWACDGPGLFYKRSL